MKTLIILMLFSPALLAEEVSSTCVSIEFKQKGEWISCSEAREQADDKDLMFDVDKYCNV